jgi:hypothetical protein
VATSPDSFPVCSPDSGHPTAGALDPRGSLDAFAVSLGAAIDLFIAAKAAEGASARTLEWYRMITGRAVRRFGSDRPVDRLSAAELRAWLLELRETLAPESIAVRDRNPGHRRPGRGRRLFLSGASFQRCSALPRSAVRDDAVRAKGDHCRASRTRWLINRPIDEVWAYLTDWFNTPGMGGYAALGLRQTSPGPTGVGSTLQGRNVFLGFGDAAQPHRDGMGPAVCLCRRHGRAALPVALSARHTRSDRGWDPAGHNQPSSSSDRH